MTIRIDGLSVQQIEAALSVEPNELPDDEANAIHDFVARIGGRWNAWLAVEMLNDLENV